MTRIFSCDFETTVYDGQTDTEVWASAVVELNTEDVLIFHSIDETFNYLKSLKTNVVCYYHNLKFDGSFWLSYLLLDLQYEQAYYRDENDLQSTEFKPKKLMDNKQFRYSISDMGQWYSITIKVNNHFIEIRDSLKLLPFSVKELGKSFGTKHKKLDMEYTGYRYAGCEITDKEKEYIANDVLVVKEALEIMFAEGHNKLTIGACCLSEYKKICNTSTKNVMDYDEMFPDLYGMNLDSTMYGSDTVGNYIRKSYKGAWCYLVKGKEGKLKHNGSTADVNSLYPSMMHSQSGNRYPVGTPHFWNGDCLPPEAAMDNRFFFIRIKTRFYIKDNMLPFIQIKHSTLYKGTEALETSDVYDKRTNKYYTTYKDVDGNIRDTRVELTLTQVDYYMLLEHYELVDFEILDGCWFYSEIGIFDEYINIYKKIKMESKGAKRTLAKLFLNNLYGKLASSTNSSFKVAFVKPDASIGFYQVQANDKQAGYIPCGSAITAYARHFTISAAQANYYGVDKQGFIYADTDSIHCDLPPNEIKGITVHPTEFCCWALESNWDVAIFTRQKTYIEHVTHVDQEPIEQPYYDIKCAGMPQHCKDLFSTSMQGTQEYDTETYTDKELEFLFDKDTHKPIVRTLDNFSKGLKVPGKLLPKRIKGGILLVDSYYEMR